MDHYLDIRLRTDPEFTPHQLMSALYAKLHRALVQHASTGIGISFPTIDEGAQRLGDTLRLHGNQTDLDGLDGSGWLQGMRDLVAVSPLSAVSSIVGYRAVFRVQAKSSVERLRRRAMRRHGITAEAAASRIPDSAAETLDLPFVQLGSRSTGQPRFNLYIQHGPLQPTGSVGKFNSYGLSREATVPWFQASL